MPDRKVVLQLNEYQAVNLRWLLRMAYQCQPAVQLNTGDWNGEILWELEQQIIENDITQRPNVDEPQWPLQGWHGGKKQREAEMTALLSRLTIISEEASAALGESDVVAAKEHLCKIVAVAEGRRVFGPRRPDG